MAEKEGDEEVVKSGEDVTTTVTVNTELADTLGVYVSDSEVEGVAVLEDKTADCDGETLDDIIAVSEALKVKV